MRVEYERYSTLMTTVNEMFSGKYINVYEAERQRTPEGRKITFGVNWGAVGTTTPAGAREFADNLKDAAAIAELLNRMEIVYYYDENEPEADWDALAEEIKKAINLLSRWALTDALTIK